MESFGGNGLGTINLLCFVVFVILCCVYVYVCACVVLVLCLCCAVLCCVVLKREGEEQKRSSPDIRVHIPIAFGSVGGGGSSITSYMPLA